MTQTNQTDNQKTLKRSFGFGSILGFSCTVLITWEGVLLTFPTAYTEVGPAGTVYTYIFVWLGITSTYICLCELCSMMPTSGGQYHWVSKLAPRSCHKFLSYITAWLVLTGWQASSASGLVNAGLIIRGLIKLCNPDYVPKNFHTTLIGLGVILLVVFINIATTSSLARFEGLILVLHIVGFFAILIPITFLGPHVSASDVFNVWLDLGNWNNRTYAFFIGLVGPAYAFVGADSAVHMAEEVQNAAVVVPRAILLSIVINGSLGFGMLLALLFGLPSSNVGDVLGTRLGFPFIQIFLDATLSIPGTAIMASIILTLGFSSTVGSLASCSRLFWSLSRDRGLPLWQQLIKIDGRTSIPIYSVLTASVISALLILIGIGSPLVFNDIVSINVTALYASYLLPVSFLLGRRILGMIQAASKNAHENSDDIQGGSMLYINWGPFRVPGIFGIINNLVAVIYLVVVLIFAFWPLAQPVTPATMNYASLVLGTVVLLSILWYLVYARKIYGGPIIHNHPESLVDVQEVLATTWFKQSEAR